MDMRTSRLYAIPSFRAIVPVFDTMTRSAVFRRDDFLTDGEQRIYVDNLDETGSAYLGRAPNIGGGSELVFPVNIQVADANQVYTLNICLEDNRGELSAAEQADTSIDPTDGALQTNLEDTTPPVLTLKPQPVGRRRGQHDRGRPRHRLR